jgi:hypothetical protein
VRVFFSHPMKLYGTEAERRQLALIKEHFAGCEVVDPSRERPGKGRGRGVAGEEAEEGQKEGEGEIKFYLRLVDSCDCLVFSRLFGNITEGVIPEVEHALSDGKQVYELRDGRFIPFTGPIANLPLTERLILRAKGALGMAV